MTAGDVGALALGALAKGRPACIHYWVCEFGSASWRVPAVRSTLNVSRNEFMSLDLGLILALLQLAELRALAGLHTAIELAERQRALGRARGSA